MGSDYSTRLRLVLDRDRVDAVLADVEEPAAWCLRVVDGGPDRALLWASDKASAVGPWCRDRVTQVLADLVAEEAIGSSPVRSQTRPQARLFNSTEPWLVSAAYCGSSENVLRAFQLSVARCLDHSTPVSFSAFDRVGWVTDHFHEPGWDGERNSWGAIQSIGLDASGEPISVVTHLLDCVSFAVRWEVGGSAAAGAARQHLLGAASVSYYAFATLVEDGRGVVRSPPMIGWRGWGDSGAGTSGRYFGILPAQTVEREVFEECSVVGDTWTEAADRLGLWERPGLWDADQPALRPQPHSFLADRRMPGWRANTFP